MMHTRGAGVILFLVLAAGCTGIKEAPPRATAQNALLLVDPSLTEPKPDRAAATEPPPPAVIREIAVLAPSPSPRASGTAQPVAKAPVTASVSRADIQRPRKNETPPPVARKPAPSLDVAALKARLRDTDAIGMFTKLALKNQVDDLLQRFREHYLSGQKTGVAALRPPYDMLVLKVLALIQDGDPSLARTIAGSREAIWSILADPEKFNSIS